MDNDKNKQAEANGGIEVKMKYIMELKNIKKIYLKNNGERLEAVLDFSKEFEMGKLYTIVGHSGAGKSTILSIMGIMDKPSSGEIYLNGEKIENLKSAKMADLRMKAIGFVFQHYYLNPKKTVADNIILALKANPENLKTEYREKAKELLKKFSVDKYADSYPDELSGGEQQRVCVARALANSPDIILADEPTGNLDAENERIIMEYMKKLTTEGKTVIVVTHSDKVMEYADEVIKMENGRIVS